MEQRYHALRKAIMKPDEISIGGTDVPIMVITDPNLQNITTSEEVLRYEYEWDYGSLDALLINKGSDTLVVSLHGPIDRSVKTLPYFERLELLKKTEYSSLFFGDPTLYLKEALSLSWYVGWKSIDMHRLIAKWITNIAASLNVKNLIISGSSGGGFAALQISSFIPNSIALAFNAQTDISKYKANGTDLGAQRNFIKYSRPDIWADLSLDEQEQMNFVWDKYFDDRYSARARYTAPMHNYALLVQNDDEFHHTDHYLPFASILQDHQSRARFRCYTYSGGKVHAAPTNKNFTHYLEEAVQWARGLPPVGRSALPRPGKLTWFDHMSDRIAGLDDTYDMRLNDKAFFNHFARTHNIPVAKMIGSKIAVDAPLCLPNIKEFVIKPNNLSSDKGVLILSTVAAGQYVDLRTGNQFDVESIQSYYKKLLGREPDSDGTLVIQERIYDRGKYEIPRDFKFYTFNGKIELVQCIDRNRTPVGVTWFDSRFEHIHSPTIKTDPKYATRVGFSRPPESAALIALAERVSRKIGTPFVRVDLYSSPRGPVCGEVSFTSDGPYYEFTEVFDERLRCKLGALWGSSS